MAKYNRAKYGTFAYGTYLGQANYTHPVQVSTNYIHPVQVSTNWNLSLRHTYGAKVNTSTRATYGEHLLFSGDFKVDYKFIDRTDYSSDY